MLAYRESVNPYAIYIMNVEKEKNIAIFTADRDKGAILHIQFLKDKRLVTVSNQGFLTIYDLITKKIISFPGDEGVLLHNTQARAWAVSSNGRLLATGFFNDMPGDVTKSIKIWDIASQDLIEEIPTMYKYIFAMIFVSEDMIAFVAGNDFNKKSSLITVKLGCKRINKLPLGSILFYWYAIMQEEINKPIILPKDYEIFYYRLPVDMQNRFYFHNIQKNLIPREGSGIVSYVPYPALDQADSLKRIREIEEYSYEIISKEETEEQERPRKRARTEEPEKKGSIKGKERT